MARAATSAKSASSTCSLRTGSTAAAVEQGSAAVSWRVDPRFSGPSYVLGDLGTHPLYIAETILPHLKIKRLLCVRQSFVKSRAPLEDNAVTLMEYDNGAFGTLWCSAVNAGAMHSQKVRIVGSKASIEWWDEHPNQLSYRGPGRASASPRPRHALSRARGAGRRPRRRRPCRRLLRGLVQPVLSLRAGDGGVRPGRRSAARELRFPDIHAGVEGVRWVENCVRSAGLGGLWVDYR